MPLWLIANLGPRANAPYCRSLPDHDLIAIQRNFARAWKCSFKLFRLSSVFQEKTMRN